MFDRLAPRLCLAALLSLMAFVPQAFAQQQPTGNANVNTQQFQDWEVICPQDASQGPCTMNQVINNADSNQPMMRVVIANPPQIDNPVMTFLMPLGVRLAPGLQLSVGGGEPVQFPYQVCQQQGCRADLPLQPSLLQSLRGGTTATLSLIAPNDQRMDVDISLMGFTDAMSQI
ncbi:invasion associated locus B family protein [Halomonas elongata]|uniref:invasion associated locus B family protein n=1 Tax=Halomonas elongata TaxID=2746 RepID=UPI000DCCD961|nr:invasion associated locus B family protein [Halomonas elongata]MDL4861952.1 invasion associated locus B family protein [Halomonas elongata]RAW09096.1 invasion associated locus B family protein [Halomonas elongata]